MKIVVEKTGDSEKTTYEINNEMDCELFINLIKNSSLSSETLGVLIDKITEENKHLGWPVE